MSTLGDRMQRYEAVTQYRLTPRSWVIIRVDGRAFHSYARAAERPFDAAIVEAMVAATRDSAAEMQGFRLAYTQSDEASFLLGGGEDASWYDLSLAKLVSISASLFTAHFNTAYGAERSAIFDSRAYAVPSEEVANVFLWRQRDWERNSLSMFARAFFTHAELLGAGQAAIHEMLHARGQNWSHLPDRLKNGTFLTPSGGEVCQKLDAPAIRSLIGGADVPAGVASDD